MNDAGDLKDMQPQVDRRAQGFHGMGLGWIKNGKPQAAIINWLNSRVCALQRGPALGHQDFPVGHHGHDAQ